MMDDKVETIWFSNKMESHTVRNVQKKRTTNFREDETKLLIQLWGSPQIQNKLYLTHRKAPVMRLLAANMQQRGFYRTPDEIKTRIRLGTVDPDWPHFKAMDAILNKGVKRERIDQNIFEGPRCEDIKQEIDIDINDDVESWATTSMGSEAEEDPAPPPPLTPAPGKPPHAKEAEKPAPQKPIPTIVPGFTIPAVHQQNGGGLRPNGVPSIPLPLLILNSLQPQQQQQQSNNNQEKRDAATSSNGTAGDKGESELHVLLKELVEVQKENLQIEKQRLDIEKQRLEFSRVVGSQLLTLVPMVGTLVQRLSFPASQAILDLATSSNVANGEMKNGKKRQASSDLDILKDSKILRTVLEQGIKKYMMGDDDDKSGENEDSGIQQDENSSSSSDK